MEAELEKQAMNFSLERDRLTSLVRIEEERRLETESQLKALRGEVDFKCALNIYSSCLQQ